MRSDKGRQISYDIISKWNLKKNDTSEHTYKIETDSQIQKTNMIIKEDSVAENKLKNWSQIQTTVYETDEQ